MPLYDYQCDSCGHRFEVRQGIKEDPLTECPRCGAPIRRIIHPVGIVFKGSGFYITDSRKAASATSRPGNGASGEAGADSAPSSGGQGDQNAPAAASSTSTGPATASGGGSNGSVSGSDARKSSSTGSGASSGAGEAKSS